MDEEKGEDNVEKNKKDIQKDTLNPVTKVNTKLDKELQDWEVESTKGGGGTSMDNYYNTLIFVTDFLIYNSS